MGKGKYEEWLKPEGLVLLEGWARDGLTDEQIAERIGIVTSTLYDWKKTYSEISESLKKGKEVVDYQVENALFKNAMKGDTTAQIFWLKNRRSDKWRDKPMAIPDVPKDDPTGLVTTLLESGKEAWHGEDVPADIEEAETDLDMVDSSRDGEPL